MSLNLIRLRVLGVVLLFSLATLLGGCSRYTGDEGAKRSEQQSQQLRDRLNTTQTDR